MVVDSTTKLFTVGDQVTVTGFDLGMNTSGGFGRYISVPALWATKLPQGLIAAEIAWAMAPPGLTAALCIIRLMASGLTKDSGEVLVTGATGGVGSVAVGDSCQARFQRRRRDWQNGASMIFSPAWAPRRLFPVKKPTILPGRPLQKPRWAGVVDTVGGNILATALKTDESTAAWSPPAATPCPHELNVNVFPFILRGVSLLGVDSVEIPMRARQMAWNKLAGEWSIDLSAAS